MRLTLLLTALTTGFAGPAMAADCKAKGALYTIPDTPGFELRLTTATEPNAYSDLEAVLTTPTRKQSYGFTASNGYSMNYMVLNGQPENSESEEGSYRIYGFDKVLTTTDLPRSDTTAPAYLFAPELGLSLYYGAGEREYIPVAMWRLQNCE